MGWVWRLGGRGGGCAPCSGTIGANTILGDERWAGAYGVEADFWAYDNCKVATWHPHRREGRFIPSLAPPLSVHSCTELRARSGCTPAVARAGSYSH